MEKEPTEILVEAAGVGYRVAVPLTTYGRLPAPGSTVTLSVHTHVREDALALYGFDSRRERDLFERLIAVPGIGPRLALALMSHMDPGDLIAAVRSRDVSRITRVPGIGLKTAERLVIELASVLRNLPEFPLADGTASAGAGLRADLLSALQNLGYRAAQVAPVLEAVLADPSSTGAPVESLIREALRRLAAPARRRQGDR